LNCALHSDVPGIGVCVSCRRVVCDRCSTRLQGRNFCSQCLSLRALAGPSELEESSSIAVRAGLGMLTIASMGVLVLAAFAVGFFLYMVG